MSRTVASTLWDHFGADRGDANAVAQVRVPQGTLWFDIEALEPRLLLDATPVSFECEALEDAVRAALHLPAEETITEDTMLELTSLSADSNLIDSLDGLQSAQNLQSLELLPSDFSDPGHLSTLEPLAGLNNLTSLSLQRAGLEADGQVDELATLGTPDALETLDIRYNSIEDISSAVDLPALKTLQIYGNPWNSVSCVAGRLINVDLAPGDPEKATTVSDLAASLYYLPLRMYEYVLNNIEYEIYEGAMKGPQAVLETKAGNDWDTAALLAALLDEADIISGVDTTPRFTQGRIKVPTSQAADWLGLQDSDEAEAILINLANGVVTGDSSEFDHVWLNTRIKTQSGSWQWFPLDASWKLEDPQLGLGNMLDVVPFDFGEYLAASSTDPAYEHCLAYEYYEDAVLSYLARIIHEA